MGNSKFISTYSSWYPAVSDRHIISQNAEEYLTTDLPSEQRQKLRKKELTESLSGFFDDLSGCRGKTSPDNAVTSNIEQFVQKILLKDGNWSTLTGLGNL